MIREIVRTTNIQDSKNNKVNIKNKNDRKEGNLGFENLLKEAQEKLKKGEGTYEKL